VTARLSDIRFPLQQCCSSIFEYYFYEKKLQKMVFLFKLKIISVSLIFVAPFQLLNFNCGYFSSYRYKLKINENCQKSSTSNVAYIIKLNLFQKAGSEFCSNLKRTFFNINYFKWDFQILYFDLLSQLTPLNSAIAIHFTME